MNNLQYIKNVMLLTGSGFKMVDGDICAHNPCHLKSHKMSEGDIHTHKQWSGKQERGPSVNPGTVRNF